MIKVIKLVLAISTGVVLGAVSLVMLLQSFGQGSGQIQNGPWSTDLTTGGADASMYTRARVALGGLLALSKEETIYFTAYEDNEGLTLSDGCDYTVIGRDPATRWWSITAYASDNYLPQNDDNQLSMAQSTVRRDASGQFAIKVSAAPQAENWISSRNAGNYSLTLRLYNPAPQVYEAPATTPLPKIIRGHCQ
ncbi:MAG: DUF1214 domain-containing protein [Alphaproteobacteria bacterium]